MRRAADAHELLDGPLDDATLHGNLGDLERVNRYGGGAALSWRALERLRSLSGRPVELSLLDIGTGAADIPRDLLRRAVASQLRLAVTATDIRPQIVNEARRRSSATENLHIALANTGKLEFADGAFDVAHASMVLHHLEPDECVELLAELGRVARLGVIVNDLDRRQAWWLGAWLLSRIATRNGYTRHDAPLSVRRGYRPDETKSLAARAGLREQARLWARPPYRYASVLVPA
jgi:2-polyprenyl-3-methyl-5-hydroxy-6-metoxy-1,4-benzoquinol methylase